MALTNAEKQARWRDRNLVRLTDSAEDIAGKLAGIADRAKLAKISRLLAGHLKYPKRNTILRLRKQKAKEPKNWADYLKQHALENAELNRAYMASEITEDEYNAAKRADQWPEKLPRPEWSRWREVQ